MINIQTLKRYAKKFDAIVENDSGGRYCTYQIIAPNGKQWIDNGGLNLRVEWQLGDTAWKNYSIQEAIERMSFGVEQIPE